MTRKTDAGFTILVCHLCADHPQFETPGAFPAHMTDVHGYDMTAKYQRIVLAHTDARDWYQWDYEWKRDGVTFATQSMRSPRRRSN